MIKILLVEDDAIAQKVANLILAREGYHISNAANGEETIALIAIERYDLILLDLGLPDYDGLEIANRIRNSENSLNAHAIIVALTAHSSQQIKEQCLNNGFNDFLTKPFDQEQLKTILMRHQLI